MAAVELEWIPESLYNTAISAVVDSYTRSRREIRSLPENIQFDVYYKVCLTPGDAIFLFALKLSLECEVVFFPLLLSYFLPVCILIQRGATRAS